MTASTTNTEAINAHYGRNDLAASILAAMQAAGKNIEALTIDDLAPVDQFHTRGKQSTLELAQRAGLTAAMHVLDVGGGIGGPARTLASEVGCTVTILDITEEFCRSGAILTARTGLSERVTFKYGSALDIPFPAASFDAVWTQHSTMNIADKERLYAELFRVTRPGGRLALYEIMAGPVSPVHFPVPWARTPDISSLRTPVEVRTLITKAGFKELSWIDETEVALEWFKQRLAAAAAPAGGPPLGLHLLLGEDFRAMFHNVLRNLEEQRAVVIQGVFERV